MSRLDDTQSANPLWSGLGLIAPLRARVSGGLPAAVGGISIDTRTLAPGDLFFAITGDRSDGHAYVETAFAAGAAAAVVDEAHADSLAGAGNLFVVHDVLQSLNDLGRAARARTQARVIAVTGSVGKTSSKEALRLALTPSGTVHASAASYNNHWGVPLTLARMPRDVRFCVSEIGMNHAGEITPLTAMVRPHVAIVTTVAPVHLEFFASVEAIADAKAEIFSGLESGGVAILNRDNGHFGRLNAAARQSPAGLVSTFGVHESADARLLGLEQSATHCTVQARIVGRDITYRLGAPGRHLAENSLAVLLAAVSVGADLDEAAGALAFFQAQQGRGERLTLHSADGLFTLVDECYNANPASMRAALAMVGAIPTSGGGRRIAVLGDMLELGEQSRSLHAELADDVLANGFDAAYLAGANMEALADRLQGRITVEWQPAAAGLVPALTSAVRAGDVVVVKGSNGSRMSVLVDALKTLRTPAANPQRASIRAVA